MFKKLKEKVTENAHKEMEKLCIPGESITQFKHVGDQVGITDKGRILVVSWLYGFKKYVFHKAHVKGLIIDMGIKGASFPYCLIIQLGSEDVKIGINKKENLNDLFQMLNQFVYSDIQV